MCTPVGSRPGLSNDALQSTPTIRSHLHYPRSQSPLQRRRSLFLLTNTRRRRENKPRLSRRLVCRAPFETGAKWPSDEVRFDPCLLAAMMRAVYSSLSTRSLPEATIQPGEAYG